MSRNHNHNSSSSGVCIYCNVFFAQLAAHMLSSETCMLASQQSLLNKRNCLEHDNNSHSKNPVSIGNCHVTRSISQKIDMLSKYILICDKSQSNSSCTESVSHNKIDSHVYEEDSIVNNVSSYCYTETVLEDDGNKCNEVALKPSWIDKLLVIHTEAIQVVPIDSDIFDRNFTPEEHFMINLCNICDEANAPLDLVDKIVGVI